MGIFTDFIKFSRIPAEDRSAALLALDPAGTENRSYITSILNKTLFGGKMLRSEVKPHNVTPGQSIGITSVYACIKVISETMALLPTNVNERVKNGGRVTVEKNHIAKLFRVGFNPETTAFEAVEFMLTQLCMYGNAYFYIERNAAGQILELWQIPSFLVTPNRLGGKMTFNVVMPERIRKQTGKDNWKYDSYNILHIKGQSLDGVVGISPIEYNARSVGMYVAAQEYGENFYLNGASPSGVVTHPNAMGDESYERLKESANSSYSGLKNAHKLMILEEGAKYEATSISPQDAQYIQFTNHGLRDVCRIYRMKPHMVADLENATYSNIEHESIGFATDCILPWATRIESAFNQRAFLPSEKGILQLKFNLDGLMRGDYLTRMQGYAVGKQWGILTTNEIRGLEDLNPIKGGDALWQPMNMIDVGMQDPKAAEKDIEKLPKRSQIRELITEKRSKKIADNRINLVSRMGPIVVDALARVSRREAADIGKQANKHFKTRNAEEFIEWLIRFYAENRSDFIRMVSVAFKSLGDSVIDQTAAEIGEDPKAVNLDNFIRSFVEDLVDRHGKRGINRIKTALEGSAANSADQLEAVEDVTSSYRNEAAVEGEAKNESNRLANAVALAVYGSFGYTLKRWVANGSSCPACEALDGTVMSLTEFFMHSGHSVDGDERENKLIKKTSIKHPPAHAGCDCMVTVEIG